MPSIAPGDNSQTQDPVREIVLRAMRALAPGGGAAAPLSPITERLAEALLESDPAYLAHTVASLRQAGLLARDIAETYVPSTARMLGLGWERDQLDFRQVSIGAARLQGLLRQFDTGWGVPPRAAEGPRPAILLAVAEADQHTLGASVLAGQLRHRGISVHLDLSMTAQKLATCLGRTSFAGVFLSASLPRHLETCGHMVDICRRDGQGTPVIIGGTILDYQENITPDTGCDLATSDMTAALGHCGLADALLPVAPDLTQGGVAE